MMGPTPRSQSRVWWTWDSGLGLLASKPYHSNAGPLAEAGEVSSNTASCQGSCQQLTKFLRVKICPLLTVLVYSGCYKKRP